MSGAEGHVDSQGPACGGRGSGGGGCALGSRCDGRGALVVTHTSVCGSVLSPLAAPPTPGPAWLCAAALHFMIRRAGKESIRRELGQLDGQGEEVRVTSFPCVSFPSSLTGSQGSNHTVLFKDRQEFGVLVTLFGSKNLLGL